MYQSTKQFLWYLQYFLRKLQEWCVSEDIIENFRRENIQGRHLNYLTEYMIKKGLLSNRTEQETPENVRPLAARLGPLKTVCRALKMHVGQAKGIISILSILNLVTRFWSTTGIRRTGQVRTKKIFRTPNNIDWAWSSWSWINECRLCLASDNRSIRLWPKIFGRTSFWFGSSWFIRT